MHNVDSILPHSPLPDHPSTSDQSYFTSVLAHPPPLASFDAFKKTSASYKERSTRGAFLTIVLAILLSLLVYSELKQYLWGEPDYSFSVDRQVGREMQINVDVTIATPCHFLTIDVRDAVGDRLHISDEFKKEGTTFEIGQAQRLQNLHALSSLSASSLIRAATSRRSPQFTKTSHLVENGPACRVFGIMHVKKVTGNLHITTLGHGYLSWEHTDHALMNLSHVIHEFSFGDYFPRIAQPLDNSVEITPAHFHIFQYFLSVVSTTYISSSNKILHTNQYSVTDMSRETEHGKGVPGIFLKYDIEPMSLTIRERTMTLLQFLIRLAGIVGGIVVCSDYGLRTFSFLENKVTGNNGGSAPIPTSITSPIPPQTHRFMPSPNPGNGGFSALGGGGGRRRDE